LSVVILVVVFNSRFQQFLRLSPFHPRKGIAGHVARDAVISGEVTSSLVVVANFLSLTTFVTMRGGVAAIDLFFSNICWYRSDRDITLLLPSSGLDQEVLAIFSVR